MTQAERLRAIAPDAWMALPRSRPSPGYDIQAAQRETQAACEAGAAALEREAQLMRNEQRDESAIRHLLAALKEIANLRCGPAAGDEAIEIANAALSGERTESQG